MVQLKQAAFNANSTQRVSSRDIKLAAARKISYNVKDCIVIEDSLAGIEAALAANMRAIGFLGGSHAHYYDWYKLKMSTYNIPIAQNSIELSKILTERML